MTPTPQPLLEILNAINAQTAHLTAAAAKLSVTRNFTLDGRLVGDIGEMLAAQYLELILDGSQRKGHDAIASIDGKDYDVQIKCRKASERMEFTSVPVLLVVIVFNEDWTKWEIVYNGDGSPIATLASELGKTSVKVTVSQARKWPLSAISVPTRPAPLELFV